MYFLVFIVEFYSYTYVLFALNGHRGNGMIITIVRELTSSDVWTTMKS